MSERDFDFAALNDTGKVWEIRIPGEDAEDTWEQGYMAATLRDAVERVFPGFAKYGLSLEQAAEIVLELDLVLSTGVPVSEMNFEDDE